MFAKKTIMISDKVKETNYMNWFFIFIAITSILRLFVIGRIGLGDDEGHYFAFSRHLELSYFDHPPVIGYLIKLSTLLFGINEFAVRFPTVLIFFLVSLIIFILAKELFNDKTALLSVILINITPVFSFLGAVMTVPDAPLSLFWMLYMLFFWLAINPKPFLANADGKFHFTRIWVKKERKWAWYAMGAVLGLGLLSKYNMILVIPSTFMFLFISRFRRVWFKRAELYLSLIMGFVIFLPVVIWNLENSWASFGYQLQHGFGNDVPKFSFALLGKCLGAQAGYISPFLFFIYWFVLFWLGWHFVRQRIIVYRTSLHYRAESFFGRIFKHFNTQLPKDFAFSERFLFLFCFAFPILFLFNAIASYREILPHWPAMGYLVLSIAVAYFTIRTWNNKFFRVFTFIAWGFGAGLTVLVPLQAMYKILPPEIFLPKADAFKLEDGITKAEKVDVTNELYGWADVGRVIGELQEKNKNLFIFTFRHYLASQLSFYVPSNPDIYCLSERIDAYDFWQRDISGLNGKDAIFVSNARFYKDPVNIYLFKKWKKLKPVEVLRNGRKIRIFYLWYGTGFNLGALDSAYTSDILPPKVSFMQGLRTLDYKIFWKINKDMRNKYLDYVMRFFSFIGNGAPLAVLTGIVLWVYRRKTFMRDFFFGLLIVLAGSLIVHLLKDVIARVRPLTLWGDAVHVLGEKLYRCSFPSGHSQSSFSAATYLSYKFRKKWWIFYVCAFIVAFSRVYNGVHFPLDVIAGSLIGFLTSMAIINAFKSKILPD